MQEQITLLKYEQPSVKNYEAISGVLGMTKFNNLFRI